MANTNNLANPQRGDIRLEIGDRVYVLRATFDALARFEERSGATISQFATQMLASSSSIRHVTTFVEECLRASGGDVKDGLGEKIRAEGLITVTRKLLPLVIRSIGGDQTEQTASGEAAPAA